MKIHSRLAVCSLASLTLLLGACSSSPEQSEDHSATSETTRSASADSASFPRDIQVGDNSVHIESEPQRIVVASTDGASVLADLIEPERIIATPDIGDKTPSQATKITGSAHVDPEQLLSFKPDLVVLTSRHGQEKDASELLKQAGVPTVSFASSAWSKIDSIEDNIRILGQATGAEEKADEIIGQMEQKRNEVTSNLKRDHKPRVMILMARGGTKMLMPANTLLNGLVREAGGSAVIDEVGSQGVTPADPEVIAQLKPDVILISDHKQKAQAEFKELLENPALADVPAIKNKQVKYLPENTTGASSGSRCVEGLKTVAEDIGTL
ncbi:ABC transporter substrate-binding protein [Corynebacterium poyangense]|uniref:ABC transporter substrate-binding protein n=1 Tax=Corynebacterium poyangense TaxID=2684405 RepID=A0A7H0SQW3_9CORY|nr:ABC transporter substrate-binding protein [Corynebacterium poyangense]QNQ90938.1 ABC transporter substrate-binding protein [Corynebacterium poyangense]